MILQTKIHGVDVDVDHSSGKINHVVQRLTGHDIKKFLSPRLMHQLRQEAQKETR